MWHFLTLHRSKVQRQCTIHSPVGFSSLFSMHCLQAKAHSTWSISLLHSSKGLRGSAQCTAHGAACHCSVCAACACTPRSSIGGLRVGRGGDWVVRVRTSHTTQPEGAAVPQQRKRVSLVMYITDEEAKPQVWYGLTNWWID